MSSCRSENIHPASTVVNVRDFGAAGDGRSDDSAAIQRALFAGARRVIIPDGAYRICNTLRVPSDTAIEATPDARIFSCGETPKKRGDFLLTNSDHLHGNENIAITGGVWDGNNQGRCNVKDPDLFNPEAWSGTVLNFYNVRNLRLEHLIIANSVVYNTRFCRVENFILRDIGFRSDVPAHNQDGLHFNGFVRNGLIEEIHAITPGQTNDDLLALNADDSTARLENFDIECGPIENLTIRNVSAENCHTAIRLLSVTSPIRNIIIENLTAGCRCYALNMDAARYCRTPLFRNEDFPEGVGCIENVVIDHLTVWRTAQMAASLICCESNARNFLVRDFRRDLAKDTHPDNPTFKAANLHEMKIRTDDHIVSVSGPGAEYVLNTPFSELELNGPVR